MLANFGIGTLAAHEADDVLHRLHRVRGDNLRTSGTIGQHRIDIDGVGDKPLHFGIDRAELGDGEVDERGLERGELGAAELIQHVGFVPLGERRVDANQIVGLRPRRQAFFLVRQRIWISLRPADLVRNRVGVVGQVDA